MKINPFSGALDLLNRVREKQDHGGNSGGNSQRHQDSNPFQKEEKPSLEVNPSKIDSAIAELVTDSQIQSNGLNASVIGAGPGLKVVLKDGTGAIIRQFTGEEFLRLREAASQDTQSRGKILDRKL